MLVLSRHVDEQIVIGDDIIVTICRISADKVRIGIDAPKDVPVHRKEIYDEIRGSLVNGRGNNSPSDG